MKDIKIFWQELDTSIVNMNPMERLQYSTKLSYNRPQDEPWVAVIKPTTLKQKNYVLSLSLDAYHMYSVGVLEEFEHVCQKLVAMCKPEEIEEIRNEEIEKGNTGKLYQVNEGLLRLLIPSRLLSQSKRVIESVFQRTPGNIVDKRSSD